MSILPCMKCKHSLGSNAPNLFCEKFHVVVDHRGGCGVGEPIVMTNADRIRSMTDEELAEWMCTEYRKIPWCRSDNEEDIESGKCRPQVCIICANVWLKEEVGDVT